MARLIILVVDYMLAMLFPVIDFTGLSYRPMQRYLSRYPTGTESS